MTRICFHHPVLLESITFVIAGSNSPDISSISASDENFLVYGRASLRSPDSENLESLQSGAKSFPLPLEFGSPLDSNDLTALAVVDWKDSCAVCVDSREPLDERERTFYVRCRLQIGPGMACHSNLNEPNVSADESIPSPGETGSGSFLSPDEYFMENVPVYAINFQGILDDVTLVIRGFFLPDPVVPVFHSVAEFFDERLFQQTSTLMDPVLAGLCCRSQEYECDNFVQANLSSCLSRSDTTFEQEYGNANEFDERRDAIIMNIDRIDSNPPLFPLVESDHSHSPLLSCFQEDLEPMDVPGNDALVSFGSYSPSSTHSDSSYSESHADDDGNESAHGLTDFHIDSITRENEHTTVPDPDIDFLDGNVLIQEFVRILTREMDVSEKIFRIQDSFFSILLQNQSREEFFSFSAQILSSHSFPNLPQMSELLLFPRIFSHFAEMFLLLDYASVDAEEVSCAVLSSYQKALARCQRVLSSSMNEEIEQNYMEYISSHTDLFDYHPPFSAIVETRRLSSHPNFGGTCVRCVLDCLTLSERISDSSACASDTFDTLSITWLVTTCIESVVKFPDQASRWLSMFSLLSELSISVPNLFSTFLKSSISRILVDDIVKSAVLLSDTFSFCSTWMDVLFEFSSCWRRNVQISTSDVDEIHLCTSLLLLLLLSFIYWLKFCFLATFSLVS